MLLDIQRSFPRPAFILLLGLATAALLSGCGPTDGDPESHTGAGESAGHEDHAHAEQGPHGGHLIELGRDHEYHAELVENAASQSVVIYILDSQMKELAIDSPSLSLTLNPGAKSFELAAGTESELNSQFHSDGTGLYEMLEGGKDVSGKLRVTIAGTPYVGEIRREEHDHAAHTTHQH